VWNLNKILLGETDEINRVSIEPVWNLNIISSTPITEAYEDR